MGSNWHREKCAMKYFTYNDVDYEMAYNHKKNDHKSLPKFFTHVYKSSSAELTITSVFQFQIYGESVESYILQSVISSKSFQ